jgi:2-polyprenyl-6-methoxyphenol hydroxylase-like FAD-dependent oxidoreductase
MLAGELAMAGADVGIIEQRMNQDVEGSRANGLHPRSIELLDQRGIAERFISQGTKHFAVPFAGVVLDASDRPSRHNYTLALWQEKIERTLAAWVSEHSVTVYRGCRVTNFKQNDSGVNVELHDGRLLRAKYLVGCDGGRSLVRKKAGIAFPGWEPSISYLIFEADVSDEPIWGIRHGEKGIYALGPLEEGKRVRGVVTEPELNHGDAPNLDELRGVLTAAYGTDFGVHNVTWLSRFTDAARQAETYRDRRVLLAGDAAHIHSPAGGQGLQIGLQDAVNLGWKLARVVRGVSPESLLDTYETERHAVGAAVLKHTLAITALNRGDDGTTALREMMTEVMQQDEPRKWYTALMSGLDIRYDLGEGHPVLGRRMPDLDLLTSDGPIRVFTLMHDARPVLLNLGEPGAFDAMSSADHIKVIDGRYEEAWRLPVIGHVSAPGAVLIRPDGYVAWAGDRPDDGLNRVLTGWFGEGRSA